MTRIERVDVEGFKGIGSLNVEPTAINIITGRNNTGKTSLLEAIQLVFNPKAIRQFGANVDTLVNVDYEQAVIAVETEEGARQIKLHQPGRERTREILIEAVVESATELAEAFKEHLHADSEVLKSLDEEIRTIIVNNLNSETVEGATDQMAIITIDDTEYPFLYPMGATQQLYKDVADDLRKQFFQGQESDESLTQATLTEFGTQTLYGFSHAFNRHHFIGDEPPSSDIVTIVDTPDLTDRPETEEGEMDAVKIDDIEDFLIKKNIVENLRNFDLDYLVFEDEKGEKYSVPYGFMGDGFKAIVGVLWELLDEEISGNIVLLEEPGGHMHPGYIRELVYFLVDIAREGDMQLFVTTHNNDFISDFFGENLTDEERVFLQEEFTLIQMQEDAVDVMSYKEADNNLKDLHLDLRGL